MLENSKVLENLENFRKFWKILEILEIFLKILENFRKHLENIFEQSETKRIPLKIKKFTLEVKDPLNGKRQTNKNWFQESASLRGRLKMFEWTIFSPFFPNLKKLEDGDSKPPNRKVLSS